MPPVLGLLLGLSLVGALHPDLKPPQHEPTEQGAALFASDYNSTAEIVLFKSVSASWNYYTNLTAENAALQVGGGTGAMPPRGRPQHQGLGGGGLGHGGDIGMVPFLLAGSCLSTLGWQTRAGTCSLGTAGVCPKLSLGEALPWSDSLGPGAESGLFLEVIPSSQHLPLSFPPFPDQAQV